MISKAFSRLTTVTASTLRMGAVVDGLSGDLAVNEADFKCLPLDPVTPEVAMMAGLDDFAEILMTITEATLDILEGDVFWIATGTSYKVRAVGQWTWRPTAINTLHILLEETK